MLILTLTHNVSFILLHCRTFSVLFTNYCWGPGSDTPPVPTYSSVNLAGTGPRSCKGNSRTSLIRVSIRGGGLAEVTEDSLSSFVEGQKQTVLTRKMVTLFVQIIKLTCVIFS